MIDHRRYTYRVTWSEEDQEYLALCAEFPSLSYLANNPTEALEGLVQLVGNVIEDMEDNNEDIPQPLSEKIYSGKFQVRIPPEQHRNIAIKAAEEGISLNRYISSRLIPC